MTDLCIIQPMTIIYMPIDYDGSMHYTANDHNLQANRL